MTLGDVRNACRSFVPKNVFKTESYFATSNKKNTINCVQPPNYFLHLSVSNNVIYNKML